MSLKKIACHSCRSSLPSLFYIFGILAFLTSLTSANAQFVRDHKLEGELRSFHGTGAVSKILRSFESDTEARAELSKILSAIGLNAIGDRIILRASAETSNAEAGIGKDGTRFIFYNAVFMQNVKQKTSEHWSLVSILSHELGHHLAYHTELEGRYHEFELEADYFSGFVLRRLGASLDQAQAAMRLISPVDPGPMHPGLEQRVQAITIGWTDGSSSEPPRGLKKVESVVVGPQSAPAMNAAMHSVAAPRIALVVGNGNYKHLPKLPNAVLDAAKVSSELQKRGFKVIQALNLTREATVKAITDFETVLSVVGGTGLFYYAGSAAHIDGEDIMLPVDASKNATRSEIEGGVNLTHLTRELQSRTISAVQMNGSAVIYAASKGEVTLDGRPGDTSPFASAFIDALSSDSDELVEMFRKIKASLPDRIRMAFPQHKQNPVLQSNLDQNFYFGRPEKDPSRGVTRIMIFDGCRDNPFSEKVSAR